MHYCAQRRRVHEVYYFHFALCILSDRLLMLTRTEESILNSALRECKNWYKTVAKQAVKSMSIPLQPKKS